MAVAIEGIGAAGGFGVGVHALKRALENGKSPSEPISLTTPMGVVETRGLLVDPAPLTDFIPARQLRRVDRHAQIALLGSFLAIKDAGMLRERPSRMGIIVATGYGATCNRFDFLASETEEEDLFISPTKFSNSVHNAAAAQISLFLKEHGPNLSINHFDMSITSAFLTARQWLEEKRVDAVLIGGVDEYSNVMGYYRHVRMNSFDSNNRPEESAALPLVGEGSVFFVLRREEEAARAYCLVDNVVMGNTKKAGALISEEEVVFFNDKESPNTKNHPFAPMIPEKARTFSYTDLYGELPIGMGFDIAMAAISLKEKKLYASPSDGSMAPLEPGQRDRRIQKLERRRICCLKISEIHEFGAVYLSAA